MRLLFYSPDSYGLGHVRRSISLARATLRRMEGSTGLLLTGAPRAHYFDYPENCDYVKLPSITKDEQGGYVSRDLDLTPDRAVRFREGLIQFTAASFKPDALLVDHSPLGLGGEILPTLRRLGAGPRKTVRILGLRDVIDDPDAVKNAWARDGVIDVLRNCYDLILVYGQQEIFDPIQAYGIPLDVSRKIKFVGYVPRNGHKNHLNELKARYAPRTGRLVVVALGGGGDGNLLMRSFFEGYRHLGSRPPFEVAAVTGPLMSRRKRERFRDTASELAGLSLIEYTDQMPDLIEAADFVVAMGGYNTISELACAGARALVVPRTFPRREQLVRARLLAQRGVVQILGDEEPDPDTLIRKVRSGLEAPWPERGWGLQFTALEKTSDALELALAWSDDTPLAVSAWGAR